VRPFCVPRVETRRDSAVLVGRPSSSVTTTAATTAAPAPPIQSSVAELSGSAAAVVASGEGSTACVVMVGSGSSAGSSAATPHTGAVSEPLAASAPAGGAQEKAMEPLVGWLSDDTYW
jgi:hypothetical protein